MKENEDYLEALKYSRKNGPGVLSHSALYPHLTLVITIITISLNSVEAIEKTILYVL